MEDGEQKCQELQFELDAQRQVTVFRVDVVGPQVRALEEVGVGVEHGEWLHAGTLSVDGPRASWGEHTYEYVSFRKK